jgi:hypothetical protein
MYEDVLQQTNINDTTTLGSVNKNTTRPVQIFAFIHIWTQHNKDEQALRADDLVGVLCKNKRKE